MRLKNNLLFKNGILFAFFSFLNSGVNFLLLLLLANFILPSGYGELNLFNTFITLLAIFISLNATGIIAVDFFSVSKVELRKMLNTVLFISTVSFLFFSLLLFVFSDFLEHYVGLDIDYQWIGLLICYTQLFSTLNLDLWRLEEKPVVYGIYSTASVLVNFVLTLLFVVFYHMDWLGRVYAQVGVAICFFFIAIYCVYKRDYFQCVWPDKDSIRQALSFGLPLIPHSTSIWVRQGLDRYIINYFSTIIQVGLYSFAYNFANIIHIIGLSFNATNSVYIYKNISKDPIGAKKILLKQTKTMILFFVIVSFVVYGGSVILIPLLVPKYIDSIPFLFPLCMSALFQCVYYLFVNYLFYYKKTRGLMYITFSLSLLHVLLSVLLTRYSVVYTAYLTMVVNMMIAIGVFLYSRRIYKLI